MLSLSLSHAIPPCFWFSGNSRRKMVSRLGSQDRVAVRSIFSYRARAVIDADYLATRITSQLSYVSTELQTGCKLQTANASSIQPPTTWMAPDQLYMSSPSEIPVNHGSMVNISILAGSQPHDWQGMPKSPVGRLKKLVSDPKQQAIGGQNVGLSMFVLLSMV